MKLWKKLENLFAAAAFAEEAQFETAREIAAEEIPENWGNAATVRAGYAPGSPGKSITPTSSEA